MAVIEIARIQVRRGQENQTGIPQLAGGEFAWAEDTENLYIGLKREDGGARDANIRVLTENDVRLFNAFVTTATLAVLYTWEGANEPTITSSDSTYANRTKRSTQSKLDDFVTINDFGILTNTEDDTVDFQNAIDHLFLDQHVATGDTYDDLGTNTYNKKLYIPAGVYTLSGPIYLPKNTVLVGEGIDKTIIECLTTNTIFLQTVDYNGRRGDSGYSESNTYQGVFDDSYPTTIYSSGQPKNIHIEGMTIRYSPALTTQPHESLLSLDCVDRAVIRHVKFKGNHIYDGVASPGHCGINIRGYANGGITSENILIEDCEFNGLHYGIKSNYDINNISVKNNYFYNSEYGVGFNTATNLNSTTGPVYSTIANNKFNDINKQGIYVGTNINKKLTYINSQNNTFVSVGNNIAPENSGGVTSIINFGTQGNSSINDYFDRQRYHNQNFGTSTYYSSLISGKVTIDSNAVTTATLSTVTNTTLVRLPLTDAPQYFHLRYIVHSPNDIDKLGTLHVYLSPPNASSSFTETSALIFDEYHVLGYDGAVYWGVDVNNTTNSWEVIGVNPYSLPDITVEYQTKLML